MKIIRILCLLLVSTLLVACAMDERKSLPRDNALYKACKEPRPQICTREYQPVCGVHSTQQSKTYGNACTACGDAKVIEYRTGACDAAKPASK